MFPSYRTLQYLLHICGKYAEQHDTKFNTNNNLVLPRSKNGITKIIKATESELILWDICRLRSLGINFVSNINRDHGIAL